jgi:hypothetical protein
MEQGESLWWVGESFIQAVLEKTILKENLNGKPGDSKGRDTLPTLTQP